MENYIITYLFPHMFQMQYHHKRWERLSKKNPKCYWLAIIMQLCFQKLYTIFKQKVKFSKIWIKSFSFRPS